MTTDDPSLHEAFAELREHDRARTPTFAAVLGRRPRRRARSHRWLAVAATLLVVAGLTAAGLHRHRRQEARLMTWGGELARWSSPTDFLLETPGRELVLHAPAIGRVQGWPTGPLAATDDRPPTDPDSPEISP